MLRIMNRLRHLIGAFRTSRLAAVAAFLALAGISAGLARTAAQTVEGLDLDAIKARAGEQTGEEHGAGIAPTVVVDSASGSGAVDTLTLLAGE